MLHAFCGIKAALKETWLNVRVYVIRLGSNTRAYQSCYYQIVGVKWAEL